MARRESDQADRDGHPQDPLEEVGPAETNANPAESEFRAGELDGEPEADRPNFAEELLEQYEPDPGTMVPHPVDGLPVPADEHPVDAASFAPSFTYDHVVCVGDDRVWVELFEEETGGARQTVAKYRTQSGMAKVPPIHLVTRTAYTPDGAARQRLRFDPKRVTDRWGFKVVELAESDEIELEKRTEPQLMIVRPVRPPCLYYKRQVFSNDSVADPNSPGHKIVFRNCVMRRSVGGALMSLRDEAIYACDYREPADPNSVRTHLDEPDKRRLESKDHLVMVPLFREETIE